MECKFKQIANLQGPNSVSVRTSQSAVNNAISCVLGNVVDHMYNKSAIQKCKTFLKNKIINFQVDSVKQIYQNRPTIPTIMREQQSPRKTPLQCLRPMSAQIRRQSQKNTRYTTGTDSKKSIQSRQSQNSYFRSRRNSTSTTSLLNEKKKKRNFNKKASNQKKFFAVINNGDIDESRSQFIEALRLKKLQQENENNKKQQFLRSIQLDSTAYSAAQSKFMQSVNRKKFIYGNNGQIIQINSKSTANHLKKISTISKSRVEVKAKQSAELKRFQQQLKQNIYIEFNGRQSRSRPSSGKMNIKMENIESFLKNGIQSTKDFKKQYQNLNEKKLEKQPLMRQRQCKTAVPNSERKKQIQKILFYNSPNSIYRVINDVSSQPKTTEPSCNRQQ